jgi:hypothetical protein
MAPTTLGTESVPATPEHHHTTRRRLLAVFGATSALAILSVPAIATSAAPSSAKWDRRLANYYRLLEAQEVYYSRHMTPANDRHDATKPGTEARKTATRWVWQCEEEFGLRVDRTHEALNLLLLTPAPGMKQLAIKLELAAKEGVQDFTRARAIIAAMSADARRLLANGRA